MDIIDAIAVIRACLHADSTKFDCDTSLQSHIYRRIIITAEASFKLGDAYFQHGKRSSKTA
jgi:hypothetical protein